MSELFSRYRALATADVTFEEFLVANGYGNPARDTAGMDDGMFLLTPAEPELSALDGPSFLRLPDVAVIGDLRVLVLLVDFPDKGGRTSKEHFEEVLFGRDGQSMTSFFDECSLGKVSISGSVHGWLRMPEPYASYTNNESGMEEKSYPHNAQRMAEDAVSVALEEGVTFDKDLDKIRRGVVTALFIVHAGRGAEELDPEIKGSEIWSHKWTLTRPIKVNDDLAASTYLTVPEDCKLGVCAHELGHLAFQWQDFYDPNYETDGIYWDGSGMWDLMAGGSYNGDGLSPAHPAALHKAQHGWIELETISAGTPRKRVTLPPYSAKKGRALRVESPRFGTGKYLLLENRQRSGFDEALPGSGLLVWRVDESSEQNSPKNPGMTLLQADARNDLNRPNDRNQGDAGDPFPGAANVTSLSDSGIVSTSFPGEPASGITLSGISMDEAGAIILDVSIE